MSAPEAELWGLEPAARKARVAELHSGIVHGRDVSGDLELEADTLVIGSGAGGAVVACHLAEAGERVVVVEEGEHVPPAEQAQLRPSESLRRLWIDAGLAFALPLGDTPAINVMMGRAVGGSSVLTGGVCFRIPGRVLREWSGEMGLHDYTEARLDAAHLDVERAVHVEEVPESMRSRSTTRFVDGARRLGVEVHPIRRNTVDCRGCGRCNFGCPEQAKLSVDQTYLPRALAAGAQVLSDCRVESLVVRGARVDGCWGHLLRGPERPPGGVFRVRARRTVVSGGAYGSPVLLGRSGIGRRSGQVGRNMTVHPAFRVMARFRDPIRGWQGALQSAYSEAYEADNVTLTGLFVPPGVLAATMPGVGREHVARARDIPHLAIFGGMVHDQGGGHVFEVFGRRAMTYRMAPRDKAAVPVLMRRMAEIFFAAGAEEVFLPVLGLGGVDADRMRTLDLERVRGRDLESGSQHPLGTCRMGVDPKASVVGPDGAAWDVKDLFVVDGSILPTSLGVNPQLSIMTVATHLAWKLRERRPRG
ncbi:MAG: GMC family oxidoreductase [Polyangiaceae bacterium]|nr:GMC family oxidoreductase [Polyangiaceae bacterium]